MNKKIIIGVVILSLIFSLFIFKKYKNNAKQNETLYLIQVGAYKSYDNVANHTKTLNNYLVHEEDGLYKIFIGASLNDEVYDTLVSHYNMNNSYKKEIKINNEELIKKINSYDNIIKSIENKEAIDKIVQEEMKVLSSYLKKESI